jgi:hypothetical protein
MQKIKHKSLMYYTFYFTHTQKVNKSLSEGAVALAGGKRPSAERCQGLTKGHFFEPTVLGNMTEDNTAFQEELFGPVVSVFFEKHVLFLFLKYILYVNLVLLKFCFVCSIDELFAMFFLIVKQIDIC